jgi:hypothetical protein
VIRWLAVRVVVDQRAHELSEADLTRAMGAQKLQEAGRGDDAQLLDAEDQFVFGALLIFIFAKRVEDVVVLLLQEPCLAL